MKKCTSLLLAMLCLFNTAVIAQTKTVTGKVTDDFGSPLAGVTVNEKGKTNVTLTDEAGEFSITVSDNAVLVFSFVGFSSRELTVGTDTRMEVILLESQDQLEEVVVTALGIKRQQKSLGYAVQQISGGDLADAKETNLTNALSGKVAGLQVVRSSNGAGGSSKIVLRGNTSLTGTNQPLIVVDGIPIDNFTGTSENGYWAAGFDRGNGLGDISAEDIETMSVLKGPSAAALYGSRAGNGVILITTKSGKKRNGLGITFSTTQGIEDIFIRPEIQNTFGQGELGSFDPTSVLSWGPKAEGQMLEKWDGTTAPLSTSHDNVKNFLRKGTTQNYNLSFQQQIGNTGVYTSLARWIDQSIIPENKLERTNITTRATSKFGRDNKFTTDFKISYNNTSGFNRPINGRDVSNIYVLYTLPRSMDIRDFNPSKDEFGEMIWYHGAPGWQNNPYWNNLYNLNKDSRDRFMMSGSVKYQFTDWLDAEIRSGADIYTTSNQRKVYAGSNRANEYSEGKETFMETNHSAMITARKDHFWGKLGGLITVGGNVMEARKSYLGVGTGQLEVPDVFSLTNGVNNPSIGQSFYHKKINSLFGNVSLNYDGYIYFDITSRNDWSSALIKKNQSYFYPSYSLSLVVSEMLGANMPRWFNYAKMRGAYATVGNDLDPFNLINGFSVGKDPLGNTTASRNDILLDPNVKSELIKNLEFGAELRFFDSRVGLDVTWYKSNATNQLINLEMDPLSGYAKRKINAGDIQNKGIEIMADVKLLHPTPNALGWTLMANFTKNENKIIDIAKQLDVNHYDLGVYDDVFIRAATGGLYGDIYGSRLLRVKDEKSPNFGQLLLDGDGLPLRDGEIVRLGNQQPKGMIGVTNSFVYKNFGLSFLVDARLGGEIFSASNVGLQAAGVAAVTAPNGERPDMIVDGVISDGNDGYVKNTVEVSQQLYWRRLATLNNLGVGDFYTYDATNIRLRNVQVSYAFPKSVLSRIAVQNARIALSCNNVWMIKSHLNGIDPESVFATGSNAVGFESGAFPTMRSFLVSLNIGF